MPFAKAVLHDTRPPLDARLFLDALEEPWRTEIADDPRLDEWLAAALDGAREAWPGARPCPGFLTYLASKVPTLRMAAAFVTLRARELFLMYSCLHADPRALAEFESMYQPYVARALKRMKWTAQAIDEAGSVLRERLFFPEPGDHALALDYSGRGDLGRWLRSVAVRAAFKERERERRHVAIEGHADALATDNDPEQDLSLNREGATFAASLLRALAGLPLRDRKLLFRHYYEGLSLGDIARRHRVHRATAARWLADARENVLQSMRRELSGRMTAGELEAFLRTAVVHPSARFSSILRSVS
jgi:RNA polymerase sigma-70 factor, ECF subfamily